MPGYIGDIKAQMIRINGALVGALVPSGPAMQAGFPASGPLRLDQARYIMTDAAYLLLEFSDNVTGEELAGILEVTRTDTAQPIAAPLDRTSYKTVRLKLSPAAGHTRRASCSA